MSLFPQNNNFFETLSLHYISKIWNIWELIITETPLIICADSPSLCSDVVLLLSSIMYPLDYLGDVRPYFTIYDTDFKDYRDESALKANSPIIGTINPICIKTFNDWAVIHFDDLFFHDLNIDNPTKGKNKFRKEFILDTLDIPNYKRKFALLPNKALIKTFIDYLDGQDCKSFDKINMYLRTYLIELNNDFMRTFEDYFFTFEFESIKRIALFKKNFSIFEIFNVDKFIKYLSSKKIYFNSKYIKDKKKTVELYSNFIKTKCFNLYLKNLLYYKY